MCLDGQINWDGLWPEMEPLPSVSLRDRTFLRGSRAGSRLLAEGEAVRATVPTVQERARYLRDWYANVEHFTTGTRLYLENVVYPEGTCDEMPSRAELNRAGDVLSPMDLNNIWDYASTVHVPPGRKAETVFGARNLVV
eukprot:gene1203-800_t